VKAIRDFGASFQEARPTLVEYVLFDPVNVP
jgi:hypothetical protein